MNYQTYYVKNVEEAIELAQKFKEEGKYDHFRGQTHEWPPHSSALRNLNNPKKRNSNLLRIIELRRWMAGIEQLRYLLEDEHIDEFFAICQHYGLSTNFIDFSTMPAVAGFFSADNYKEQPSMNCCIYCLDSNDLKIFASNMEIVVKNSDLEQNRQGTILRLIEINVDNLWRLQSQHGVFLYCNYNWEIDYPMDRILFPYTGNPIYPPKDIIYPYQKSPLEYLLDHYFRMEKDNSNFTHLRQIIEKRQNTKFEWEFIPHSDIPKGFIAEVFLPELKEHPSWNDEPAAPWKNYSIEIFDQTIGEAVEINFEGKLAPGSMCDILYYYVKHALETRLDLRKKSINWKLTHLPSNIDQLKLFRNLTWAWDGMRRLPYSAGEIAGALSNILLLMAHNAETMDPQEQSALEEELFEKAIKIEFAYNDQVSSQALIHQTALKDALRSDIKKLLVPDQRFRLNDMDLLLICVNNPRYIFEFPKFKALFGRFIIPWQFILFRQPVFFDCYHLSVFGLK
ncbi:FRG domain-containing protein [Chitinophaga silvatica]|nr:FRG domain-containing protein [Chitinophaga silvatica]